MPPWPVSPEIPNWSFVISLQNSTAQSTHFAWWIDGQFFEFLVPWIVPNLVLLLGNSLKITGPAHLPSGALAGRGSVVWILGHFHTNPQHFNRKYKLMSLSRFEKAGGVRECWFPTTSDKLATFNLKNGYYCNNCKICDQNCFLATKAVHFASNLRYQNLHLFPNFLAGFSSGAAGKFAGLFSLNFSLQSSVQTAVSWILLKMFTKMIEQRKPIWQNGQQLFEIECKGDNMGSGGLHLFACCGSWKQLLDLRTCVLASIYTVTWPQKCRTRNWPEWWPMSSGPTQFGRERVWFVFAAWFQSPTKHLKTLQVCRRKSWSPLISTTLWSMPTATCTSWSSLREVSCRRTSGTNTSACVFDKAFVRVVILACRWWLAHDCYG